MNTFSQASQDIFVRALTNNKKNGTFLEIGSNDPITHNNTYVLENENLKGFYLIYMLFVNLFIYISSRNIIEFQFFNSIFI